MSVKITCPPIATLGKMLMRVETPSGATVELRGPEDGLRELVSLFERDSRAGEEAREALAVGKVGYHVVYFAPEVGLQSASIQFPAPGIRSKADVGKVQASIQRATGVQVTVISWTAVDIGPEIEIARTMPPELAELPANGAG